jgi:hypothetical protein
LAGCTIRHFAGQGVGIEGGNEHRLVSCDIYSLGRGGIALVGGDRKTLTPSGHRVENCHVYDLSRIDHTYTPAVWCGGVGHRLAHNWFHDIRSSAIRLDANDCLVEWNEICRVVLESDDQGAVDMFGDPTFRGNVYRFNYFHHVGSRWATGQEPALGQAGIRLDDAISGTLIYANIFYRVGGGGHGFGGVQIHGGKDNILDHNLFVDCPFAVSFSPWGDGRWRQFVQNSLASPSIDRGLYAARYPALARLPEDHDVNGIWRNRAIGCGELFHHNASRNRVWDNLVVTNSWDWQGTAPGDFGRLPADDRARRWDLPGAAFSRVGLYPDTWRPQAPTAAIRRVRETGQSALPLLRRP